MLGYWWTIHLHTFLWHARGEEIILLVLKTAWNTFDDLISCLVSFGQLEQWWKFLELPPDSNSVLEGADEGVHSHAGKSNPNINCDLDDDLVLPSTWVSTTKTLYSQQCNIFLCSPHLYQPGWNKKFGFPKFHKCPLTQKCYKLLLSTVHPHAALAKQYYVWWSVLVHLVMNAIVVSD